MKRVFKIFVILCCVLLMPATASADRRGFVNTVVIDPGHGGRDPGAVGRNSREKDIALAISLKLGNYIKENLPDVKVIYTRETDEFVELFRRAQIANESQADLFISIHCNSTRNSSAYGTETFVMGLHRSEANLEVARKENASILFEDDYMETYDGFDPHSPEANIIFSLYQNAYLDQSLTLSSLVQDQFRERAIRTDRGVKQAGFLVLYQIAMPGILVETGFLSNAREEQYLMSETGQTHIASAIYRAFRDYKQQQDALAASRKQHTVAASQAAPEDITQTDTQAQTRNQSPRRAREQAQARNQSIQEDRNIFDVVNEHNQTHDRVCYRVQIAVSAQPRTLDDPELSGKDISYYFHEGLYKYTAGNFFSLEEAVDYQKKLQQAGFTDAFVVAFLNNNRISADEARRIISLESSNP